MITWAYYLLTFFIFYFYELLSSLPIEFDIEKISIIKIFILSKSKIYYDDLRLRDRGFACFLLDISPHALVDGESIAASHRHITARTALVGNPIFHGTYYSRVCIIFTSMNYPCNTCLRAESAITEIKLEREVNFWKLRTLKLIDRESNATQLAPRGPRRAKGVCKHASHVYHQRQSRLADARRVTLDVRYSHVYGEPLVRALRKRVIRSIVLRDTY